MDAGLVAIIFFIGLIVLVRRAGSQKRNSSLPGIRITTSFSRGGAYPFRASAEAKRIKNGVVFNPSSALPISLNGVSLDDVSPIVDAVNSFEYPPSIKERLALLIAQRNAESPEMEAFLARIRKPYMDALDKELAKEPGYEEWPEADRADFIEEAREEALEQLELCVQWDDIGILMHERPADAEADDEVTRLFGSDHELFRDYIRLAGSKRLYRCRDRDDRKRMEKLMEMGLAVSASDLPPERLLQELKMKELQEVLGEDAPKKFTRKAEAVAFAAGMPGIIDRLAEKVPIRSLYAVKEVPGIEDAVAATRYAREYAGLIVTTLITESRAARAQEDGRKWTVEGEPCFLCKSHQGKTIMAKAKTARPPHHVGCTCELDLDIDSL